MFGQTSSSVAPWRFMIACACVRRCRQRRAGRRGSRRRCGDRARRSRCGASRDQPRAEVDEGEDRLRRIAVQLRPSTVVRRQLAGRHVDPLGIGAWAGRSADIDRPARRTAPTRAGTRRPCRARAPASSGGCSSHGRTATSRARPRRAPPAAAPRGRRATCHSSISAAKAANSATAAQPTSCAGHAARATSPIRRADRADDRQRRDREGEAERVLVDRLGLADIVEPVALQFGRHLFGPAQALRERQREPRDDRPRPRPDASASRTPRGWRVRRAPAANSSAPAATITLSHTGRQRVAAHRVVGVRGEHREAQRAAAAERQRIDAEPRASPRSQTQRSAMIAPAIAA